MIINLSKIDFGGVATGGGNAKPEEVFDVQPTTAEQTITPTEGSVFSGGTVRAVTKEIDVNIVSNNIKEGVTILGVAGTLKEEKPEESFNVQPTTAEQTITPTAGSVFSGGTVRAVTSAIDSNIVAGNIKEGVTILGVAGTLKEGSGGSSTSIYDGSFDEDGLRAIGWTDEDIALFEEANPHYAWEDENYRVTDANKALYGKVNMENIRDDYKYNPDMRFVPKFNINYHSNWAVPMFNQHIYVIGIPYMDYSKLDKTESQNGNGFFSYTNLTYTPSFTFKEGISYNNMFLGNSRLRYVRPIDLSKATSVGNFFANCSSLVSLPPLDLSSAESMGYMFADCSSLMTIPTLITPKCSYMNNMFSGCTKLTTVNGIDFSGFTSSSPQYLFGSDSNKSDITRFIVNGKINVSISDNYSIKALTAIDYDSVKSILAAADRTDNTNAKTLAFNRTMTDQNGELAALVTSCTSKGWTINGLTLQ